MTSSLTFIENRPLDVDKLAALVPDRDDLHLVWPLAAWPFDKQQWQTALAEKDGHRSYYVYDGDRIVGHAALKKAPEARVYIVSYLYLSPAYRARGLGGRLIGFLESVAMNVPDAATLRLVVRDYNPNALKCYLKAGFVESSRDGTAIHMTKPIRASRLRP